MYAKDTNPIVSLFAKEGIKSLAFALPMVLQEPSSSSARSMAMYGAWLCGKCLATTTVALHHKLCHVLGGSFNLPHAETHAVILPHVIAYNAPAIPEIMKFLADTLPNSNGDGVHGLNVLISRLGGTTSLRDLGMKEGDISKAADILLSKPFWNPRKVEKEPICALLRRACNGEAARLTSIAMY
jgi:alcohol dehydrogenase class IV